MRKNLVWPNIKRDLGATVLWQPFCHNSFVIQKEPAQPKLSMFLLNDKTVATYRYDKTVASNL